MTTFDNSAAFKYGWGARMRSDTTQYMAMMPQKNGSTGACIRNTSSRNISQVTPVGLIISAYDGTNTVNYKDGVKETYADSPSAPNISCDFLSGARNSATTSGGINPNSPSSISKCNLDFKLDRIDDTDEANLRAAVITLTT